MSDDKPNQDIKKGDEHNHYSGWPELKKNPYLNPIEAMWAYGKYEAGSYMKNFSKGKEMEKRLEHARVKKIVAERQEQFASYVQRGKELEMMKRENEKKP